jgi:hypothetical protein
LCSLFLKPSHLGLILETHLLNSSSFLSDNFHLAFSFRAEALGSRPTSLYRCL